MGYWKASKYLSFLILPCLFLGQVATRSAEAREDAVPGSRYTSARGAAMGDAFLPLADDDASALFYNPASLGKIRRTGFDLMNLSGYGDTGWLNNFSATNFYKVTSLSSYQPTLADNPGRTAGVGFSYLPNFYTRGFGFGVLLQSQLAAIHNPDGSIHYRSLYQLIPTAGFGLRLAEGIVKIGYSLQYVNEAVGDITKPAGTTDLGYNQGLAQGAALSHNVGMTLTMPWAYLPAFSLVARNIGGTHYSTNSLYHFSPNPSGAPASEPMTLDSAFSLQPKVAGGGSHFNLVGEFRDMTDQSGISILGRLAAGVELSVRNAFYLRGGWGSGYPAAGIGLRQKRGEFSLTWYSEELGQTYHADRDQRFLFQYSVRAF